ncbi:MAG: D-alanyl-D-alanine carboxypeptidase family protein [Christensenellales bacterium]
MKKVGISLIAVLMLFVVLVCGQLNNKIVSASSTKIDGVSSAKSYIVIDNNGTVLLENNADEKKEVASICKLMTSLITLENIEAGNISLDDKFVASDYACMAEGSQAFLDSGCEYSVRDLLKSVIVASANDSAIVLAENIAGSEKAFVEKMNEKAREIGMKNTVYANSTGLHDNNAQYSTARDTAIILNKVSNYPIYREDCKIWMDTLTHPSGRETELVNTNRLIKYYPYCLTGKTGYTDEAGYCLSSTSLKDNLKLTCVVLGCKSSADRFSDSVSLYNYAYANYRNEKIIDKNIPLDYSVEVNKGKENSVKIAFEKDYYLTRKVDADKSYDLRYSLPSKINAPVNFGDIVGYAEIVVNDEIVDKVNIVAIEDIEKQSYKDIVEKILDKFPVVK